MVRTSRGNPVFVPVWGRIGQLVENLGACLETYARGNVNDSTLILVCVVKGISFVTSSAPPRLTVLEEVVFGLLMILGFVVEGQI